MTGRPVTPLHQGHVGLRASSGMLSGFFGEGEMQHIARWRSVKYVDQFNEKGESEGETILRKRQRFSHEPPLPTKTARSSNGESRGVAIATAKAKVRSS